MNRNGTVEFARLWDGRELGPRIYAAVEILIFGRFEVKIHFCKIFMNRNGTVEFALLWDGRELGPGIYVAVVILIF